jgi:hypothetical protein
MSAKWPNTVQVAWMLVGVMAIGLAVVILSDIPKPQPRATVPKAKPAEEKPEEPKLPPPPDMDQGNALEGTPEQEAKWRTAVRRAQSIVKFWFRGKIARFEGNARDGGPQVIEDRNRWVVTGDAVTREGDSHPFKVRLKISGNDVVTCSINGVEYGPAPKNPQ